MERAPSRFSPAATSSLRCTAQSEAYGTSRVSARSFETTKVRKETLESDFVSLLAELRPQPDYLGLFREVVLDVWQERQQETKERRAALEAELREIKRRRDRLVEVYVYQQTLSEEIYQEQMGKPGEAQALAQMQLHDAQIDEIDIEAVLAFSEHLALRTDRMWIAASLDQRQMLQKTLYPQGLKTSENLLVRTAPSLLLFGTYDPSEASGEGWYPQRDSNPCCRLERAES